MDFRENLGDIFYTLRKVHCLTQVEMAKKIAVNQSYLSKIERGIYDDIPFSLMCNLRYNFSLSLNDISRGVINFKHPMILKNHLKFRLPNEPIVPKEFVRDFFSKLSSKEKKVFANKTGFEVEFLCIENLYLGFEVIDLFQANFQMRFNKFLVTYEKHQEFIIGVVDYLKILKKIA